MTVSDLIPDLLNSSWLRFQKVITDEEFGYLLSLDPEDFGITRDNNDIMTMVQEGDNLSSISYRYYETPNYAPLLYLLNDVLAHPLILEPGTMLWIPHSSKIYAFLRDFTFED